MAKGGGRGGRDADLGWFVCMICFLISFITWPFLLGYSYDTLGPLNAAFEYNRNTQRLDISKVYNQERGDSGRWFTGLGKGFDYQFPKQHVRIVFGPGGDSGVILCRSSEGVVAELGLSLQYSLKLSPSELSTLFYKYGTEYQSFYIAYIRGIVRDVSVTYPLRQMWESRSELGDSLRGNFSAMFDLEHAKLESMQLTNLEIPRDVQDAIEITTVAAQRIEEANFALEAETVRAQTQELLARENANITVVLAEANANATLAAAESEATSLLVTFQAEGDAYSSVKEALSLNETDLMSFVWIDSVLTSKASKTIIGIDQPAGTTRK